MCTLAIKIIQIEISSTGRRIFYFFHLLSIASAFALMPLPKNGIVAFDPFIMSGGSKPSILLDCLQIIGPGITPEPPLKGRFFLFSPCIGKNGGYK